MSRSELNFVAKKKVNKDEPWIIRTKLNPECQSFESITRHLVNLGLMIEERKLKLWRLTKWILIKYSSQWWKFAGWQKFWIIHCTLIGLLDISGWEVYSRDQKATHISMRTQQNYSLEFSCESYKPAIYCTSAIQLIDSKSQHSISNVKYYRAVMHVQGA